MLRQISSVTKGIIGCSRRSAVSSTKTRLRWAIRRAALLGIVGVLARAGEQPGLESSMYQSQNSFQKKS
jgi:hypothetical protein